MHTAREKSSPKTGRSLAVGVALVAAVTLLMAAASASAGTIAVAYCKAPSGVPAPTEGWEEGWTGGPLPDAGDGNECAAGGPLVSYVGDNDAQPASSGPYWQYTPPAGYKIVGGEVSAAFSVPGGGEGFTGAAGLLGPKLLFDQADVIAGPAGGTPATYEGTYSLAGHTGGSLWIYAFCEPPGDTCPVGDSSAWYWALADVNSAMIELEDASTPQGSGFSGTLLSGTASGTAQLEFTASEAAPGPGIYTVIVSVDGHVLYDGTPDANAGKCVSVGRDAGGVPEFLYADPCPLIEQVDLPIDTTSLADGHHELQVTVVDAAGVAATAYDGTITTANRTTVSSLLSSPLAPAPRVEPTYAIVLDKRTAALGKTVRRSYADSALTLSGQLKDTAGAPAPGVTVSLVAQDGNQPAGALVVLAHTITNTAGEWELDAPKGPSRDLRILYGAVTASRAEDAVAIKETVRPSLTLHVETPGGGRIVFSGRLAISPMGSPRPLVTIETQVGREWEAVGHAVRVNANGAYRYVYRSSPLTLGRRFAFRAQTPETSLWQTGASPTRKAVVH
jgi:hypothetical protein